MASNGASLSTMTIIPDSGLRSAFLQAASPKANLNARGGRAGSKAIQVLASLEDYPTAQALTLKLKQTHPAVVVIDVASNLDKACALIEAIVANAPKVSIIGIHEKQDPDAIVRVLRSGAVEFLALPIDNKTLEEVAQRLLPKSADHPSAPVQGQVIGICSAKPGAGASTLAAQVSFAIQRKTRKKVLLIDLDAFGGTINFYLKLQHPYSCLDAFETDSRLSGADWTDLTCNVEGVDVLGSPDEPAPLPLDSGRLAELLETLRTIYDFIILDLPCLFSRSTVIALSYVDQPYLVTTSELPSLHLTRKALQLLLNLGYPKEQFRIIVNRLNRKDGLDSEDLGKMFNSTVFATIPNDFTLMHRAVTRGEVIQGEGDLPRSLEELALRATMPPSEATKKAGNSGNTKNSLSLV